MHVCAIDMCAPSTCMHALLSIHTHACVVASADMDAHRSIGVSTCIQTCMIHAHTPAYALMNTNMHKLMHACALMHAYTHTRRHACDSRDHPHILYTL